MSRFVTTAVVLVSVGVALSGCGYSRSDRAMSGGLIGAGAGTAAAAIVGAPLLVGAAIGGGLGALGGAATNPDSVNLGKPAWR